MDVSFGLNSTEVDINPSVGSTSVDLNVSQSPICIDLQFQNAPHIISADLAVNSMNVEAGFAQYIPVGGANIQMRVYNGYLQYKTAETDWINLFRLGEITDDCAKTADLADVAFSGDYDDLIDQPTVPTAEQMTFWNNKVTAFRNASGALVLTKTGE